MTTLTPLAQRVLANHRADPNHVMYDVDSLGPMFRETDFKALDTAYNELETAKFVERSGIVVSFFGTPRELYRLTSKGRNQEAVA